MEDQSPNPSSTLPKAPPVNPAEATAGTPSSLPSTPDSWPGAFGAYKYSRAAVRLNLVTLLIIWITLGVVSAVLDSFDMPGQILSSVIGTVFAASYTWAYLGGVRRLKVSVGDAAKLAVSIALPFFLLTLLVNLTYVVSLLALVIPFFFIAPRLGLASYFMVDKKLGVMEAYKASWNATKGHLKKIYGMIGATIAMTLLALTIIGIPFAIYFVIMYSGVWAVFYEWLNKQAPATPVTNPVPSPESAV